ncbi:hypothetical protein RHGRI_005012 [Rhododendron griersonianum]|uniref:Uncharacterized protein n=1 Tax=Rhododendron griersonianum TaxID=479676 RepID=A0AAV6LCV2_9ERIC|nr:hypothetical protein RHGRI_005012 [Rhododendron griersonianum]
MASRLLVTGQGNAMLTACQDHGWLRHGKPIACHRARQCMTHGMPKQGVAKAWQAYCLSPGKAMHCSRHMPRPRVAKSWQADFQSPCKECIAHGIPHQGWPRHDSRHAKTRGGQGMASRLLVTGRGNALLTACQTRGGQGMASRLLVTGQGNALLTACQNKGWPRHGKQVAGCLVVG